MTPYIFCAGWVVAQWMTGLTVVEAPDSWGYITFSPTRTVGYPIFLWLIKSISRSYNLLPHIQLFLLWSSVAFVAHGLSKNLRWPWVLGVAAISLVAKQCYCLEMITEPLFITLLLTCAGCMLHRTSILWIALCIGALILVRPSGYALLPALVVYTWHQRQSWFKCITPLVCCLILGIGVQAYRNGVWSTQSFLGHNLIGKVAFTVHPNMDSTNAQNQTFIKRMATYMKPVQEAVQQAPSDPIKFFLATPVYDTVRYKKLSELEKDLNIPEGQHDVFWRNIALEIIKQNPLGYIKDVWMNWQALWLLWDILPKEQHILKNQYAQKLHENHPDIVFQRFEHNVRPLLLVYALRLGLGFTLLLSLWSIISAPWWRRQPHDHNKIVVCTLSLLMHGSILLTALLQAGLPRYVIIFWPYFWLLILLWIGMCYEQYRCRHPVL